MTNKSFNKKFIHKKLDKAIFELELESMEYDELGYKLYFELRKGLYNNIFSDLHNLVILSIK
jgi:hypothetical protein